jgi:hypothetical protein
MSKKQLFIEQRDDGKYSVRPPKSEPIATTKTQAAAIKKAHAIDPDATLHVERVRNVGPGRDKWRKL